MKNCFSYLLLVSFIFLFSNTAFAAPNWNSISKLIKDQKITQAFKQVDTYLTQSIKAKDNKNWRQALILGAVLRNQREQHENAINYLNNHPWPQDDQSLMLINLHKAYLLSSFTQRYRWEIQSREKIKTKKKQGLKKKTMTQLVAEINQSFAKAYIYAVKKDQPLSDFPLQLADFKNYFSLPNYPKQVRGTLRDTITYLWVQLLQDSSLWEVGQSNESVSLKQLLAITYKNNLGFSKKVHPLKRIAWLLSDLEHYEISQKKPEAAMEALRVKIETLAQFKSSPSDIKQLTRLLLKRISSSHPSLPWTNMLRNSLANLFNRTSNEDKNIRRVAILKQCLALHQKHPATLFCKSQLAQIKRPSLQLASMKSDGLKKRSLQIKHNNASKVYFRAWRLSLQEVLQNKTRQQLNNFLVKKKRKPNAHWQINLAATKDYMPHKTYLTPPMQQLGYWLVVASLDSNFTVKGEKNVIASTALNLTHLVANIQSSNEKNNALTITVYNGETGQVANNVRAELWTQDYNRPSRLLSSGTTSNQGAATLKIANNGNFRLILKYNNDFTIVDDIYSYQNYQDQLIKRSLVFTDRAIYRPSQKIQWKVVAYKGQPRTSKYTIFANSSGWVKLFDANGKMVQEKTVKTNQYGSASGEFIAKAGLLLGNWSLRTSWDSYQTIKVEEYKRPTFTLKIKDSKLPFALNKPAVIIGTAKYYFGGAVSKGKIKWRINRQAVDLWRYGQQGGYSGNIQKQTIASGNTKVDANGNFIINFIPKPPSAAQLSGLDTQPPKYSYTVSVELTDSGGETRKASRNYSIGKVAITADILAEQAFGLAGKPYKIKLQRHDLNQTPRAGSAYWEVYQVQQPKNPIMPADLPNTDKQAKSKYAIKGDKLSPRWVNTQQSISTENLIKQWKDGRKLQQGSVRHDKAGTAEVALKNLGAGTYRLRYTSKDRWGGVFKTDKTFIIAHQNKKTATVPSLLLVQNYSVEVGQKVSLIAGSAYPHTSSILEVYHGNKRIRRSILKGGIKPLDFPITEQYRGGLNFVLTMVKDYQLIREEQFVSVPWTNKKLDVSFSTFRDKLQPGQKEKWRITVNNAKGKPLGKGVAEVLASMYDRSLDFFAQHHPASVDSLYSQQSSYLNRRSSLGTGSNLYQKQNTEYINPKAFIEAQLLLMARSQMVEMASPVAMASPAPVGRASLATPQRAPAKGMMRAKNVTALSENKADAYSDYSTERKEKPLKINQAPAGLGDVKVRTNFSETAFFYPHLILENNGSVTFEFEVPESLTQWKVWVSAITKDLRGGTVTKLATTSKELMVRPYLPRFLRAGDHANIEVLINNGGDKALNGKLDFDVLDAKTLKSIKANFKLTNNLRNFNVKAGQSSRLRFSIVAPKDLGTIAIRARATATNGKTKFADGEQRPLPILPSRIHLTQSRFTALKGNTTKRLQFKELAANNDRTRINDKLVVTVDGQLFYSALNALPYLNDYPYECTEQTMNRFLSSSIINSVFKGHPAIASMAKKMSSRKTKFEKWDAVDNDPNHKMLLEETPWLNDAQGNATGIANLIRILDPKVASQQTKSALLKLRKAQNASGGFPWWEGGRESVYMTAYLLHGFSRAIEFNVNVPKDMVKKAWHYIDKEYKNKLKKRLKHHLHEITLINYILSSYPDASWTGGVFSAKEQKTMLDYSFKRWRELSPLLKAYLALTLKRSGRVQQASLIFDSLMDAAKTDEDLGTYWAPEDRSWMWYNDSVDTHAFMLRTMMELDPSDKRRHGLVQWLMLNKKLNHWKSTRATAESIYSLVHYLKKENQLGIEERATIKIGNTISKALLFKPDEYTGAKNQLLVEGDKIKPQMANITVGNQSKSLMFASATWHFSTDKLPKSAQGDFFNVSRKFFKRIHKGKKWVLQPLQEGAQLKVGDQLEVQLSLRAKHAAEFVHLRAPRGAGFEPEKQTSGYQWRSRIGYYEEIRDSGANYFFEQLPAGEYAFKYRLRATTAGKFRVAPASVQSIYAPEFNAYSSGKRLNIN